MFWISITEHFPHHLDIIPGFSLFFTLYSTNTCRLDPLRAPPPCSPPSQPPHFFYHFLIELLQNLGFGFSASSFGSPPVRHSQAASDPFQMENRSRHWPKSFSLPSRYKSHSFGPFWFNAYLPLSFTSFYALLLSCLCSCHSGLLLRVVFSCPRAFAREDLTHNPSGHFLFPCGEQPPRSTWHIMDAQ